MLLLQDAHYRLQRIHPTGRRRLRSFAYTGLWTKCRVPTFGFPSFAFLTSYRHARRKKRGGCVAAPRQRRMR
jgi:hypothetical protein